MTRRRWFCFCRGSASRFFWRRRIGMRANHRHHGKGEQHHRHVAMPAMPGSALVVIEAEFVFGGLKTVLDRPAMAIALLTKVGLKLGEDTQHVEKALAGRGAGVY